MSAKPEEAVVKLIDGKVHVGTVDGDGVFHWGIIFSPRLAEQFGRAIIHCASNADSAQVINGMCRRVN